MKPPAQSPQTDIDFLGIGELLIDFIAEESGIGLQHVRTYQRFLGGSPANIAVNVARLGGRSALVAKTGEDPFGQFLMAELRCLGVMTTYVQADAAAHTSMVFVTRGSASPDVLPIRSADARLGVDDLLPESIRRARVIHASTFALASPATRAAIRQAFEMGHEMHKVISLDPNYSPRLWPDRAEALRVLAGLYPYATLTKPSLDDAQRLFGEKLNPEAYIRRFHELGAETVVLSMGMKGSLLSQQGESAIYFPARHMPVVDATGAGDAFWAGFLMAFLDGRSLPQCVLFGREIVEMKLRSVGPLQAKIDRKRIYATIAAESAS